MCWRSWTFSLFNPFNIILTKITQHYGNWISCKSTQFYETLKGCSYIASNLCAYVSAVFFSASVQNISGIKVSHHFPYFQFTDEVKSEFLEHRSCNGTDLFNSLSLSNPWDFFRLGCLLSTWVISAVRPYSCSVSSSALSNEANAILSVLPAKQGLFICKQLEH